MTISTDARILSEIWIYPIKSLSGISVTSATLTERGLQYDRRWMLVDATGRFLSQRTTPAMALFRVELQSNTIVVSHRTKDVAPLIIPIEQISPEEISVEVWDDTMPAHTVSAEADAWFSELLEKPCRLVYQPDTTFRKVDPKYAHQGEITSFSDGYPLLVIGQPSLDDLNERLELPVPMNRFRPNLVFTGGHPYEEDTWAAFRVGTQAFFGVKPCARCVLTTIDQETAEKGKEPLRTLSKYRNWNSKILLGQNLLMDTELSTVSVGDSITITETKPAPLSVS